jgi:hypothetical protein
MTNKLISEEYVVQFINRGQSRCYKGAENEMQIPRYNANYNSSHFVNFDAITTMILKVEPDVVMVHTCKEIKQKRKGKTESDVSIMIELEENKYRVLFFKRRRINENTSVPLRYL